MNDKEFNEKLDKEIEKFSTIEEKKAFCKGANWLNKLRGKLK